MMDEHKEIKLKIAMARYILLFMTLLSVVNAIFIYRDSGIYMPFSSAISTYSVAFGNTVGGKMKIVCYIVALFLLICLFLCYWFSKKQFFALLIAFPILISDTFVLIILSLISGGIGALSILDILLHIMTIVYLFGGIKAYIQLDKINNSERSNDIIERVSPLREDTSDSAQLYIDDGTKPLLMGSIEGLNVFTVIKNGKAELIINGYVCDEAEFEGIPEYTLQAVVNDIDFLFEYKRIFDKESMYLYANDVLIDSLEIE